MTGTKTAKALSTEATFGELLRQLRRRLGMTQGELATRVGFSNAQISRLEQNERLPDLALLAEKFLPALALQDEPRLAHRLLELAALARGERPPQLAISHREVAVQVAEDLLGEPEQLPLPPTPLVGREHDCATAGQRLLAAPGRLLTLVGPPGVGKTQLALAVGAKVQHLFADGVHFVPLVAVTAPAQLASALMVALGLAAEGQKSPQTRLVEHLRRKELLLILDNFEQIIEAAPLVATLLAECSALRILVTSQQPLRLRAEQRFKVEPLTPAAAVVLFFQRAQAINATFVVTEAQAAIVTAVCLRLDGLPLAIELIVPQLELFPLPQLLARLQDRSLDLLADGPRDLPLHQQTLRNAIHRSYALLAPAEQQVLRTLGLFAGGCTVDALQAILNADQLSDAPLLAQRTTPDAANEPVAALNALVRKSLVQQQQSEHGPRFDLLTTLSAYANEQLMINAEFDHLAARHCAHFLGLAQRANSQMRGVHKKEWLDRLEVEHDNLRLALQWALTHNPPLTLALVSALAEFWAMRGHDYEARRWIDQVLAANPEASSARAAVLLIAADFARRQADYGPAQRDMAESLAICRAGPDEIGLAAALRHAGWLYYDLHQKALTITAFQESLAIYRRCDHREGIADLLLNLVHVMVRQPENFPQIQGYLAESLTLYRALAQPQGIVQVLQQQGELEMMTGNYATAAVHFAEALAMWTALGAKMHVAWGLALIGEAAWFQHELPKAATCYRDAYQIFVELGNKDGMAILRHHQGQVARHQGNLVMATQCYQESLALSQTLQNRHMIARCFVGLAGVALARAEDAHATILLGAATAIFAQLLPFLAPIDEQEYQAFIATARQRLPDTLFTTHWQHGQTQGVALAVTLLGEG